MRCLPSFWAIMIVPMFDELVTMSVTDQLATGCGSWSEKRWSDTCRWSGTCSTVSGFTRPSSIAPAAVMTLFTEPGSNTAVSASFALDTTGWPVSGSTSTFAIASTSPVRGSWMIARAPRAPTAVTCRSRACSVANWSDRSIVSTTSSPGCRGLDALPSNRDRVALGVALAHELAGHAGEALVVLALDPRHALVVDVDTTDDRTSELAGGRLAARLVDQEHTRKVQAGDRAGLRVSSIWRATYTKSAVPAEPRGEGSGVGAEDRREETRGLAGIGRRVADRPTPSSSGP